MNRNSKSLLNALAPSDIIVILFVILGLLVVFFMEETAIKLIGLAVSVIAAVSLLLILKQRIDSMPPEPMHKRTQNNPTESFDPITPKSSEKKSVQEKKSVDESDNFPDKKEQIEEIEHTPKTEPKTTNISLDYNDGESGMKIVGPAKSIAKEAVPAKINDLKSTKKESTLKINKPINKVNNKEINAMLEDNDQINFEPKREFEFFITKALEIIKNLTKTKTALFFIVNEESKELILESFVSSVSDTIADGRRLKIDNDTLSKVYHTKDAIIHNSVNPSAELDLIPYYKSESGTLSFIGVPVFYSGEIIGILAADSKYANAYDEKTLSFFSSITKLLAGYVNNYTEKYNLLQASKTLDAIKLFTSISSVGEFNNNRIIASLVETIDEMYDFKAMGIVAYNEVEDSWNVITSKSNGINLQALEVEVENTLIGKCIFDGKTVYVNGDDKSNRLFTGETDIKDTFFLASPMRSQENNYGAIFMIGMQNENLNTFDINILELLSENAGNNIEKLFFLELMNKSLIIDPNTGIMNPRAFDHRFTEELLRAKDFSIPMTLFFFKADKYESFDPELNNDKTATVHNHVIQIIEKYMRAYDLFGKIDASTYAVLLTGIEGEQSRIVLEKIRSKVANSVVSFENDTFSVTLSIGANNIRLSDTPDQILNSTMEALDVSSKKTNTVTFCN